MSGIKRSRKTELRNLVREYFAQVIAQEELINPRFDDITEEEAEFCGAERDAISERLFAGQTGTRP